MQKLILTVILFYFILPIASSQSKDSIITICPDLKSKYISKNKTIKLACDAFLISTESYNYCLRSSHLLELTDSLKILYESQIRMLNENNDSLISATKKLIEINNNFANNLTFKIESSITSMESASEKIKTAEAKINTAVAKLQKIKNGKWWYFLGGALVGSLVVGVAN
ncbi:MAG: hypothetical protein JNL65_11875 [Saprospiraceae bacterium]|nr:hypothetical protein [Saprospiraceae bacterium]